MSSAMASRFKDRLNKLVSGYNKIANTPCDIILVVQSLLYIENTMTVNEIYPGGFEISINKFVGNVIGTLVGLICAR